MATLTGLAKKIAELLDSEEHQDLPLEDMAEALADLAEAHYTKTHRIMVVGQISHDGTEKPETVALGPFSARGHLDSREKWEKALSGPVGARKAGEKLAWDVKTGKGRGRYMLVPVFPDPRSAWEFFRPHEIAEEVKEGFEISIRGLSADVGPVCICGIRDSSGHSQVQGIAVTRGCPRHDQ